MTIRAASRAGKLPGRDLETARGIVWISAGNKLRQVAHAITVAVGEGSAVTRDVAEVLQFPGVGYAVTVDVFKGVIAGEGNGRARGKDIGLWRRRLVVKYIAEVNDVLAGWRVGDRGSAAFCVLQHWTTENIVGLPDIVRDLDSPGLDVGYGDRNVIHEPAGLRARVKGEEFVIPHEINDLADERTEIDRFLDPARCTCRRNKKLM